MVWESCIIQRYNTTGIIPQLYIQTHRQGYWGCRSLFIAWAKFSSCPYFKNNQSHASWHHKAGGIKILTRLEIRRSQLANTKPMRRLHFWSNNLLEGKGIHTDCYLTLTYWLNNINNLSWQQKKGHILDASQSLYVQSDKDIYLVADPCGFHKMYSHHDQLV
jgi:hypothetical protein